jgi:hypothetical protein
MEINALNLVHLRVSEPPGVGGVCPISIIQGSEQEFKLTRKMNGVQKGVEGETSKPDWRKTCI